MLLFSWSVYTLYLNYSEFGPEYDQYNFKFSLWHMTDKFEFSVIDFQTSVQMSNANIKF